MPKIVDQKKNFKHANFSNPKFAKNFVVLYRQHKLHNTYGRPRHLKYYKFVKKMKQKHGYYSHKVPDITASDKYFDRLKPEKWSSSRILEWGEQNMNYFERMTNNIRRKTTTKVTTKKIIPRLPNTYRKTTKVVKNKPGIRRLLVSLTCISVVLCEQERKKKIHQLKVKTV